MLLAAFYLRDGTCRKRQGARKEEQLSLPADRLDTGANWRVLALTQAHHRSRVSDSVNKVFYDQTLDQSSPSLTVLHPPTYTHTPSHDTGHGTGAQWH